MVEFTRRKLMATSVAAALGASVSGAGVSGMAETPDDTETQNAPFVHGELKRFSSTALGAEVTGPFVFADGTPLFSLQHPSRDNPAPYNKSGIGYFQGFQFDLDGNNDDFDELSVPESNEERSMVRGADGDYKFLAQEQDLINGGTERLGVVQTPDGWDITQENFTGTQYGDAAFNPDCNQLVATNDEGTEGYLFTNWENSPGNISRIPISQNDDGDWTADLDNAINLANTEPLRDLGGTRINCYGDLSPWNTMISSEENYSHPRVLLTATVSDIVEKGTGKGLIGACQFWNRPNPNGIQEAIDSYYGDDSWDVQGWWSLTGLEFLAYSLGADRVDQTSDPVVDNDPEDARNTLTPIGDHYPNPYRYGYHIDVRNPTADIPEPVKYFVMGRAAWEAPDIQNDLKTVYGCSDGDSKGIYKFVADEEITSYDNPMDIEGTLYAPKVTNEEAAKKMPPAEVNLEFEWMALGHATNGEVESWIANYDDVTQEDYLKTHAETDWNDDLDAAIKEADKEVVKNGNQNYITNEEIVEWASQYENNGPNGVDEELRKVPFLETRAAAKEIGATIEFNKAEGVDSVDDAGPGDYVYFAISELNDDMSNDGDYSESYSELDAVHTERVDGGVVYRAKLEDDYNVSTLEPVIVGPDASDPADVANDALINIDNVYVMNDGRVLCCEDADQFGRSYSNDCLYVYDPEIDADEENESDDDDESDDSESDEKGSDEGESGDDEGNDDSEDSEDESDC